MRVQHKMFSNSKTLLLAGVAAVAFTAVPFDFGPFDLTHATAQSANAGGANAGGSNADRGNDAVGGSGGSGGGTDAVGKPDSAVSTRGDFYGDLWVILRDSDGIPILNDDGYTQPLGADGLPIDLDDEGHPIDESQTIEVELGRLNVGRAPMDVLDLRSEEVVDMLLAATDITVDAAGRLVLTVDGVAKTIDSPLENLAIYVALMTSGSIEGVGDLPGTDFDFLVDGMLTAEDLEASAVFLAAATDKAGVFTIDEIAYINAFLGVQL